MVAEKIRGDKSKIEKKEQELSPEDLVERLQDFLIQKGINKVVQYRGRGLASLYYFNLKDLNDEYGDITFASQSLKRSDVLREVKNVLKGWV